MTTRCNILIVDQKEGEPAKEIMLYRHCDGYPEGAGRSLLAIRQLVNMSELGVTNHVNQITGEKIAEFMVNKLDGYRYTDDWHGDIEYAYVLMLDGGKIRKPFGIANPSTTRLALLRAHGLANMDLVKIPKLK